MLGLYVSKLIATEEERTFRNVFGARGRTLLAPRGLNIPEVAQNLKHHILVK